jgi:hypothetical protein
MLQTIVYWALFIVGLSFFGSIVAYAERATRQAMRDRADFQRRSAILDVARGPQNEAPEHRLAA